MGGIFGDVRYAVRTLVRAPSFTLVAVVTLGLAIGANTAVFSVVDAVLLTALPYDEPGDLVTLRPRVSSRDDAEPERLTSLDLEDYRDEPGLFEAVGAWIAWQPTLTGVGEPEVVLAASVTAGTFARVLRVQPFLGRGFMADEDRPGSAGVVLVSHGFWSDRLGRDPGALGRPLILDEEPYSIVGVMPDGFAPPFAPAAQVWRPARLDPERCGRDCLSGRALARLGPGITLEVARARADALASRLATERPGSPAGDGVTLVPLRDELVGPAARALWVLLGAVGFVLLIACTNVASLLLARAAAREGEFVVRSALGAGRPSILRQLLVEGVTLAALGGLTGLTFAAWGTSALVAMAPVTLSRLSTVSLDARVLAFTTALTLATGIVFGLAPALGASRTERLHGMDGGRWRPTVGQSFRGGFVVGQVALAMVLLVGAGLLIRSFDRLSSTELGFAPEGVLTVTVALPPGHFADGATRISFIHELVDRLEALPAVVSAAATSSLPLSGDDRAADFVIEDRPSPEPGEVGRSWVRRVTPGYFYTMGQRTLDGRVFEASDDAEAPPVVIVNEALASRYFGFPRQSPVGHRIALESDGGDPAWRTIVGVTASARHVGIREAPRPALYVPDAQDPAAPMTVVLRSDGDPEALALEVRASVAAIDPSLAAAAIVPMPDLIGLTLTTERFVTLVLSIFAFLAVVLASVGLYGVVSYGVTRRMREMGIRLALGAGGGDVQRMVVRGGLGLAGLGVVAGTAGALAVTGVLEALLYQVSVTDPPTFVAMVVTLSLVAGVASWLPGRRAGGADPVSIMREE